MEIIGEKIEVKKNNAELFTFLQNPKNFEKLMPDSVSKFEATDQNFNFTLKGMPEVGLKLELAQANSDIRYVSSKASLDFSLNIKMSELDAETTEVQLLFNGNFNPFIKMMAEKPLNNFIKSLTENAKKL